MLTNYKPKEINGVSIEVAYTELTPPAFSVWMRMHVAHDDELIGRANIAKTIEYSEGRSNVILKELKLKGYINVIPGPGPVYPTRFELKRRVVLKGNNQFITLSLMMELQDSTKAKILDNVENGVVGCIRPTPNTVHNAEDKSDKLLDKSFTSKRRKVQTLSDHVVKLLDNLSSNKLDTIDEKSTKKLVIRVKQYSCPAHIWDGPETAQRNLSDSKFVRIAENHADTQPEQISNQTNSHKTEIVGEKCQKTMQLDGAPILDLKKILRKKQERRERRGGGCRGRGIGQNVQKRQASGDWTKPDSNHNPTITFTPGYKERERMIEILDRKPSDPEYKAMVAKLGIEFLRIYSRYRRTLDISYHTIDKEKKHAQAAGVLCIYKNITPVQLIAYWAEHVGDFTELKFPPLTFLTSPGNVDQAACEVVLKTTPKRTTGARSVAESNAHSNVADLDPRLRPGLEAAGYDLKQYDDRWLMTVQCAARGIAMGFDMFVSSKLRPMVKWAVENIYGT